MVTSENMRPATVTLDGMITDLPALLPDHRWNGWECPYFRVEDVRANRAQFDAHGAEVNAIANSYGEDSDGVMRYVWDDVNNLPVYLTTWDDGAVDVDVNPVTVDGEDYVTIGWCAWVWSVQN